MTETGVVDDITTLNRIDPDAFEDFYNERWAQDMELLDIVEGAQQATTREGAEALWRMSVQCCRDAFPDGELEKGPFAP